MLFGAYTPSAFHRGRIHCRPTASPCIKQALQGGRLKMTRCGLCPQAGLHQGRPNGEIGIADIEPAKISMPRKRAPERYPDSAAAYEGSHRNSVAALSCSGRRECPIMEDVMACRPGAAWNGGAGQTVPAVRWAVLGGLIDTVPSQDRPSVVSTAHGCRSYG